MSIIIIAVVIGLTLGLLGGGGSTVTVPALVYGLGMDEKTAIATSLLVVCLTAIAGAAMHARRGHVAWRTAAIFGSTAMLGAYGGGRLAHVIPGSVLMAVFAALMVVTAGAMWRGRKPSVATNDRAEPAEAPSKSVNQTDRRALTLMATRGFLVGGVTGLVGAGGGFLIVPALALLGGLSMQMAVGTSLAIIAMNSAAGFAGYASHVVVDYPLALTLAAVAAIATVAGATWAHTIPQQKLRKGFAVFVLAMGLVVLLKQVPAGWYSAVPTWLPMAAVAGGALIGLSAAILMLVSGRIMGVSGIVSGLSTQKGQERNWRLVFIAGMLAGGVVVASIWPDKLAVTLHDSPLTLAVAGVLVGFGSRLGSGCTSGHGICGMARGSVRSWVATGVFTVTAALTVYLTGHVF